MRVRYTHAKEATSGHQNYQAIDQFSRHRRQSALILKSKGVVVIPKACQVRRKCGPEIRIELAMLSSQLQCKTTREWEASAYLRDIDVRAIACDRHIKNRMTVYAGP
jgi:hypothetical protein